MNCVRHAGSGYHIDVTTLPVHSRETALRCGLVKCVYTRLNVEIERLIWSFSTTASEQLSNVAQEAILRFSRGVSCVISFPTHLTSLFPSNCFDLLDPPAPPVNRDRIETQAFPSSLIAHTQPSSGFSTSPIFSTPHPVLNSNYDHRLCPSQDTYVSKFVIAMARILSQYAVILGDMSACFNVGTHLYLVQRNRE